MNERRSTVYNLLEAADAQLVSYEVEEEGSYHCQIMTIIGMTTSGYDMVISKLDTCIIALLANSHIKEIYHDDHAPEQMTAEEILVARIGFLLPEKSEVMLP